MSDLSIILLTYLPAQCLKGLRNGDLWAPKHNSSNLLGGPLVLMIMMMVVVAAVVVAVNKIV